MRGEQGEQTQVPPSFHRSEPFRLLAESIPQLVWSARPDGRIDFVNTRWLTYTGISEESIQGWGWKYLIHPDDLFQCLDLWTTALHAPKSFENESRIRGSDGSYRWFLIRAEPVLDDEGRPTCWFGTCTDIHSQKHSPEPSGNHSPEPSGNHSPEPSGNHSPEPSGEKSPPTFQRLPDRVTDTTVASNSSSESSRAQRIESERHYRMLFESIDQGFCIAEMIFDQQNRPCDYRIIEGNKAFTQLTGLSPTGERTVRQLLPDLEFWWVATYGRISQTSEPERFEYYAAPMKKWFEVYAFPFGARDDHQVAIFFKDITERHETAAAIEEYRRQLDTALIAGEVGSFVWDVVADRIWGDDNFSRIFDVKSKDAEAAPLTVYLAAIDEADREQVVAKISETLATGVDYHAEYRIRSNSGCRWVVARGKVERDESGRVIRFPGVVIDVTDRKIAELALRESRELLNSIIDNAETSIYAKGLDGRFILSNRRHAELLGMHPSQVIGKREEDLEKNPSVASSLAKRSLQEIEQISGAGRAIQLEERIETPAGSRDFVATKFPLRDAQGSIYAICSISTDITQRKQSEDELRRGQERLHLAQQVGGIGTFEWDIKRNINAWSPEMETLYGIPFGSFPGTYEAWAELVHPEDLAQAEASVLEALETGFFQSQWRIVRPDKSTRYVSARGVVERDDQGQPARLLGVNIDITDRELADRARRESEERFRELANAMPQLVWTADDDGTVTYYNTQASRYHGIQLTPNGEWVWQPVLHPDDQSRTVQKWEASVRTGTIYECEHRVRMADGTFRWHLSRAFRVTNSTKKQWYGTATDIHDMKLADQGMRESEERFRTLADNMSQFAWMADRSGAISWFNQRWFEYTGTTSEQMHREDWSSVYHPDHAQRVIESLRHSFENGSDWEETFPIRSSDGSYRWFLSRAVPIRDNNGDVVRWFGTHTDVTEFRQIEAELRRTQRLAEVASQAKSDFLANMSHEIRSPMTAIIGYADLLTAQSDEDRDKIETIRHNGQYLLALINDILDLSKIEAGMLGVDSCEYSPQKLVEEVVSLMRVRASETGLTLTQEFPTPIPVVLTGDPIRIRQILINLVGNAIKFTEDGSVRVRSSFDPVASEFNVDVIDTGIGMSEEELERLFQPFSQADTTISRRFGGSGLGLAISQRLAALLGGRIKVTSQMGQGSCFTLKLPVPNDVELENVLGSGSSPLQRHPHRPLGSGQLQARVLVVDDRRDVRFLVRSFISKLGGETVLCEHGVEAIERISTEHQAGTPFDVVLMDMQMPVMDGLTAVRKLRQEGWNLPIIALTANAMSTDRDLCIEAGYTDHLSKPIDVHRLTEILRKYCKP